MAGMTATMGFAAAAYVLVVRRRQLAWGATSEESRGPLAGDELVSTADVIATRAITVRTSAEKVWPWIAQLGQGRGGFYSYDLLENLVGCDIHSADRIVHEWQDIAVGDEVRLYPEAPLEVAALDPGRSLVLRGGVPMGKTTTPLRLHVGFVVREQPERMTRLLVRERYGYTRGWAPLVVEPAAAISLVMTRKMLRGIKGRAEVGRPG